MGAGSHGGGIASAEARAHDGAMEPVEQRRHPRTAVRMVVVISPNGHEHRVGVHDVSAGGARLGLPDDWEVGEGAKLRLYFWMADDSVVALTGQVVRLAVDHMGVAFSPGHGEAVATLLGGASAD